MDDSVALNNVYIGVWVNWAHGFLKGSTITLHNQSAAVLASFLATFIAIVGTQFWKILCFLIHYYRSSQDEKDGLYNQRQVILCNSSAPSDIIWLLAKQMYRWSGLVPDSTRRSGLWLGFAIAYVVAFVAISTFGPAGIVFAAGPDRLVQRGRCGWWAANTDYPFGSFISFEDKNRKDSAFAAAYVRSCYGVTRSAFQCGLLKSSQLKSNGTRKTKCGFSPHICSPDMEYRLDTGPINSQRDLGINTSPLDSLDYRRVTACSVLQSENYDRWVPPKNKSLDGVYEYLYSAGGKTTFNFQLTSKGLNEPYTVTGLIHNVGDYTKDAPWIPVKELDRTDADVSIIMVSPNSVVFYKPCNDPVFKATNPSRLTWEGFTSAHENPLYSPDYWNSFLACTDQFQYCNPQNNKCTTLNGRYLAAEEASNDLSLSKTQAAVLKRIEYASVLITMGDIFQGRFGDVLLASETLSGIQQAPLPDNHWEAEVTYWFNTGLALLQHQVLEYATGPQFSPPYIYVDLEESDHILQSFCGNQMIRFATDTTSFSVLGLALILVLGSGVILLSLIIKRMASWIAYCIGQRNDFRRRILEWNLNGKLHLHRMALEKRGIQTDSNPNSTVPILGSGLKFSNLGLLDTSYRKEACSNK